MTKELLAWRRPGSGRQPRPDPAFGSHLHVAHFCSSSADVIVPVHAPAVAPRLRSASVNPLSTLIARPPLPPPQHLNFLLPGARLRGDTTPHTDPPLLLDRALPAGHRLHVMGEMLPAVIALAGRERV